MRIPSPAFQRYRKKHNNKLKFNFIKFHKLFHNASGSVLQYTKVFPESRKIIYSFFFRSRDNLNNIMYYKDVENNVTSSFGFVTALKVLFQNSNLEFMVHKIKEDYPSEITITHKAKTEKEFNNIVRYLRTVEVEGELPKKEATYFYYD